MLPTRTLGTKLLRQLNEDLVAAGAEREAGLISVKTHDDAMVVGEPNLAGVRGRNGERPRPLNIGAGELEDVPEAINFARCFEMRDSPEADELARESERVGSAFERQRPAADPGPGDERLVQRHPARRSQAADILSGRDLARRNLAASEREERRQRRRRNRAF